MRRPGRRLRPILPRAARRGALVLLVLLLPAWSTAAALAPGAAEAPGDSLHFSIDQAVARALAHGVEMRLATADLSVAQGRVREALSVALPQVNGSIDRKSVV